MSWRQYLKYDPEVLRVLRVLRVVSPDDEAHKTLKTLKTQQVEATNTSALPQPQWQHYLCDLHGKFMGQPIAVPGQQKIALSAECL